MRFKQFLEAKVRPYESEHLELDELIAALRKHCMASIRNAAANNVIYRGARNTVPSGIYNPGSGERQSQNTSNYYTKLLDTNPLNTKFPKRSKSFIGSTDADRARNYTRGVGSLVRVFPFNDVDIGFVNSEDLWDTEMTLLDQHHNIPDVNEFWDTFMNDVGKSGQIPTFEEAMSLIKNAPPEVVIGALKKEFMLLNDHEAAFKEGRNVAYLVKQLLEELPGAYSYENLGCTIESPGEFDAAGSEVWFSGKCVIVHNEHYPEIAEEFGL